MGGSVAAARSPGGDVTFLVTDIGDSTPRRDRHAAAMNVADRRHMAILGAAIAAHRGFRFKTIGDVCQVAFASAADALAAASQVRRHYQTLVAAGGAGLTGLAVW